MKTIPVANVVGARVSGSTKLGGAPLGFGARGVVLGSSAAVAIIFGKLPRGSWKQGIRMRAQETKREGGYNEIPAPSLLKCQTVITAATRLSWLTDNPRRRYARMHWRVTLHGARNGSIPISILGKVNGRSSFFVSLLLVRVEGGEGRASIMLLCLRPAWLQALKLMRYTRCVCGLHKVHLG